MENWVLTRFVAIRYNKPMETKEAKVMVWMTEKLRGKIEKKAEKEQRSLAWVIREALRIAYGWEE